MRALLQRVTSAHVTVPVDPQDPDGTRETVGEIGPGLVLLIGATHGDDAAGARRLADRCADLRCFPGPRGPMDRSLVDVGGAALVVSQFTLYADTNNGRRPSLIGAAPGETAEPLVDAVADRLRERELPTETGRFGADMQVHLVNDGPVTLWLEVAPTG